MASARSPRLFINYRTKDTGDVVQRLKDVLLPVLGAEQLFIDRDSIREGEPWRDRLKEAVASCTVFFCVIGERWVTAQHDNGRRMLDRDDDWVRFELEHALERAKAGELLVVPLLVNGAPIPSQEDELRSEIDGIRNHQARPLRSLSIAQGDWNADVQQLIEILREHMFSLHAEPELPGARELFLAHFQSIAERLQTSLQETRQPKGDDTRNAYFELLFRKRGSPAPGQSEPAPEQTFEELLNSTTEPLLVLGEGGGGKTTSLLNAAVRVASRADDRIPIFVDLAYAGKITEIPDLLRLISLAVGLVVPEAEFREMWRNGEPRFLFLFDSFNEIPSDQQRDCLRVFEQFIKVRGDRHRYVVASRAVSRLETLTHGKSEFQLFDLVRLAPEKVHAFLEARGMGALFQRLPRELRELAGNPFMLLAIARSLDGVPVNDLPRNRGELYSRFVANRMAEEEKRRESRYAYEHVKEPLLAHLAYRMTAAGRTALTITPSNENRIEALLKTIHEAKKHRRKVPTDWKLEECLEEVEREGLLQRTGNHLQFMHESVQEYFTGLHFLKTDAASWMVELTPKLGELPKEAPWDLAEVPQQRFVGGLLMLVGLMEDASKVVDAVSQRNALIAAACLRSAGRVDAGLRRRLEAIYLALVQSQRVGAIWLGASCVANAGTATRDSLKALLTSVLGQSHITAAHHAEEALVQLGASVGSAEELVLQVLQLTDEELARAYRAPRVFAKLPVSAVARQLLQAWAEAAPDSARQGSVQRLIANLNRRDLVQMLAATSRELSPVGEAAKRVSKELDSWSSGIIMHASEARRRAQKARQTYLERRTKLVEALRAAPGAEIVAALGDPEVARCEAAALVIGERLLPATVELVEQVIRRDRAPCCVEALTTLLGQEAAATALAQRLGTEVIVAELELAWPGEWTSGSPVPAGISQALRSAKRDELVDHRVVPIQGSDATLSAFGLLPTGWSGARPAFEIRPRMGGASLYDCNVTPRVARALAITRGEVAIQELRRLLFGPNLRDQEAAVYALSDWVDAPGLGEHLVHFLEKGLGTPFAPTVLSILATLKYQAAIPALVEILFNEPIEEQGDHEANRQWFYNDLLSLGGSEDLRRAILLRLGSERASLRTSAARIAQAVLELENLADRATWERVLAEPLLEIALEDSDGLCRTQAAATLGQIGPHLSTSSLGSAIRAPDSGVRSAAAAALGYQTEAASLELLIVALADPEAKVRLAACDALARRKVDTPSAALTKTLERIALDDPDPAVRPQAGVVLAGLAAGTQLLYGPIQQALGREDLSRSVDLIERRLDALPQDVNLFWWRGHARRALGDTAGAQADFKHAAELEPKAAVIWQALAETSIELGQLDDALAAATSGTAIAANDADAWATLAWVGYKASKFDDSLAASRQALDLDPLHGVAVWTGALAQLGRSDAERATIAVRHAIRIREMGAFEPDRELPKRILPEIERLAGTPQCTLPDLLAEMRTALDATQG